VRTGDALSRAQISGFGLMGTIYVHPTRARRAGHLINVSLAPSGSSSGGRMKAGRIHHFGPPNVIVIDEIPCPRPKEGELVVRVAAAGVGPWDALLQAG
jgi:hypothetical protein